MTSAIVTTSYRGFTILVAHNGFTVLDRNGEPVRFVTTMTAARSVVRDLRRAEREA